MSIGKGGISRVHTMQIPDYLAVSNDNTMFMHMSYEEAARCMYVQQGLCVIRTYMTNQVFSCVTAIYMDNVAQIKSLCDFQVWPNAKLQSAVYPLNSGQYLIHNLKSPLQILCKSGSMQIAVNIQNVVKMPCGCKFDTTMFKSLTALYTCNLDITSPSIEYLLNLPLALHFDKLQKLPMAATMQTSPQPLSFTIPDIKQFTDQYGKDKSKAKELRVDLKEIVRNAKKPLPKDQYMIDQMPMFDDG